MKKPLEHVAVTKLDGHCGCCLKPASFYRADVGYGTTEYWGHVATDVRWVTISDCCEYSEATESVMERSCDKCGLRIDEDTVAVRFKGTEELRCSKCLAPIAIHYKDEDVSYILRIIKEGEKSERSK